MSEIQKPSAQFPPRQSRTATSVSSCCPSPSLDLFWKLGGLTLNNKLQEPAGSRTTASTRWQKYSGLWNLNPKREISEFHGGMRLAVRQGFAISRHFLSCVHFLARSQAKTF